MTEFPRMCGVEHGVMEQASWQSGLVGAQERVLCCESHPRVHSPAWKLLVSPLLSRPKVLQSASTPSLPPPPNMCPLPSSFPPCLLFSPLRTAWRPGAQEAYTSRFQCSDTTRVTDHYLPGGRPTAGSRGEALALLSLFKLTPALELTRYLQYSEFYSPTCSAHALWRSGERQMFHSGDNKVLQTDREKEKSRQLLREAKRAKESLRERCVPGGLRLHGRPARSAAAQRARPGAVRGGNGGAGTAPEPGCRLSEITTITNRLITANRRSSRRPDTVLRLSSHPSLATIRWRALKGPGLVGTRRKQLTHLEHRVPGPVSPYLPSPCGRGTCHPSHFTDEETEAQGRAGEAKQPAVSAVLWTAVPWLLSQWRGDPAGACLAGERQGRGPAARRGCGPSCHDRRRGEDCQPRRKRRRCLDKHGHVSTKRALEFKTLRQRWLAGLLKSWGTLSACACSQGPQRPQLCP
ncbi:uncharacterized protein [Sagmatias obliquidens]|uniref:uncharacterized protein n=1 Tax=Sagmatias obliquidens TaxID=3371155 RepID=UPI000F43FD93|nr:uncharacterized protein LOC113629838 [Lagenorhynchus obliquidens]